MMDEPYFPIMIKLSQQRIVVVGGGKIAARKVQGLLRSGAKQITIIAPILCEELKALAETEQIQWIEDSYRTDMLQSATLAFAATDNKELNEQISNEALACDILVCNVSEGKQGSFITPAIASHNGLTVAISSGGSSPSLIKQLKQELSELYLPRFSQALQLMERLRKDVLVSPLSPVQRQAMLELAAQQAIAGISESYEQWFDSLFHTIVRTEGED